MIKELEVKNLINKFLLDNQPGLVKLYETYLKSKKVSYRSFVEEMAEEFKDEVYLYFDKSKDVLELNSHLFYLANSFCKKNADTVVKKYKEYVCPGCLFLGKQTLLLKENDLVCSECLEAFKKAQEPKWLDFFATFKKHSKNGFRCIDCDRFIPKPLNKTENLKCPYIDCFFVGSHHDLKKMVHPNSFSNIKKIVLSEERQVERKENNISNFENKQDLDFKIKTIKDVIDQQISEIYWNNNFTLKHKVFVYQAFRNLLNKFPIEMTSYLLDASRSGGFQHKIFQEYISIIELNLPIVYVKNKETHSISSLLDPKLSLFDGISNFEGIINDKGIIKNNTQEVYIGGRKASNIQPFYIGKLLNITLDETKEPIMHMVESYSFSRIKLKNAPSGAKVIVSHLRIPPHYQMGGMVHVNKVRVKIIEKTVKLLNEQ